MFYCSTQNFNSNEKQLMKLDSLESWANTETAKRTWFVLDWRFNMFVDLHKHF